MRLSHLTWLLSTAGGGIPPVVFAIADEQRRLGEDVEVLGVRDPAREALGEAQLATARGPLALGFAPALRDALRGADPELVHLHGLFTWPSALVSGWAARTGRPTVVSPHGMLEPWALSNSAWKKRVFRALVEDRNLARARCLHALCPAEATDLKALGLRNPIAVIPNGIHLPDESALKSRDIGRLLPDLGGRRLLLFLGRVHPKKGLLLLLDAWAAVRASGAARDWVLAIAGPDQLGHAAEVSARARALDLGSSAVLSGPLYGEDKRAVLASASGFVLPSFSEGFSMAVLEAMAWKLPAVISRQCNLDVEAVGAGVICEPDPASVARALGRFLSIPEQERVAMGSRGREVVARTYTWPRVARQHFEVYRWLLGHQGPPDTVERAR